MSLVIILTDIVTVACQHMVLLTCPFRTDVPVASNFSSGLKKQLVLTKNITLMVNYNITIYRKIENKSY